MRSNSHNQNAWRIDTTALTAFLALMVIGWANIFAATYTPDEGFALSLSNRYTMQLVWMGISLLVALVIMLVDDIYYHQLAYPFYLFMIVVLIATRFLAPEIKGAHSWLVLGPVSIQPSEFMKLATALALARYMSEYNFQFTRLRDMAFCFLLIGLPAGLIIWQNDTGSALVYGSFFFMFYREGLYRWIFYSIGLVIGLFVFSFLLSPTILLALVILICVAAATVRTQDYKSSLRLIAAVALSTMCIFLCFNFVIPTGLPFYYALLISSILATPLVAWYAYHNQFSGAYKYLIIFFGSLLFIFTVDFAFDHLKIHQQQRILNTLGIEQDTQRWGYNVNQSKIAIGSGGFIGKGFMHGTQTKFDFVPEQSTDFIFCTVGEEWGFVGTAAVLGLFCLLVVRLVKMGERQREPFRRVFCYSVAGVFLFHVMVNVAMTIGLMPVIGIPLPLFSYGGSSLLAFTMLFFVAVRLDAHKRD